MKALDKRAGSASDVFCFDAEESATSNIPFERSQRRLRHGLWRRKRFEKCGRHHVDARIGALRRQDHCDEQLESIDVMQGGRGVRVRPSKSRKDLGSAPSGS